MKKLLILLLAISMLMMTACTSGDNEGDTDGGMDTGDSGDNGGTDDGQGMEESFSAEYEMKGTTSSGNPKNDTFIFNGTTMDGVITELEFDIIRNKGTEDEYSKKDIYGYSMNVTDADIEAADEGFNLVNFSAMGYSTEYAEGASAQYLVYGSVDNVTDDTVFSDLVVVDFMGEEITQEQALVAYTPVAKEAGIELTLDTPIKDLIEQHGSYANGTFVEGERRISFEGIAGGRSYGEQIDAIKQYILDNKMTLEEVYEMFKTVNQADEPIEERDTVAGATITFVGDFQRMVYVAMHGELFNGVVTTGETENGKVYEVVTQGYGGEIETNVTIDAEGKVTAIEVRDSNETADIGSVLTEDNSEFIQALIAGQDDVMAVEAVAGATVTSNALKEAVKYAQDANK